MLAAPELLFGAQCWPHHPWDVSVPTDWTLGDLEPFDVHSLGEALRGYLQDLPSPMVPVAVHGDILRVLQGKSFRNRRLGGTNTFGVLQ